MQTTGKERPVVLTGDAGKVCWVCGEVATVEVEIRNPTVIPIKVQLWAIPQAFVGDMPACACTDTGRGLSIALTSRWSA